MEEHVHKVQDELVDKPVVDIALVVRMAEVDVELAPDNPVVVEHMALEHIVEVVRTVVAVVAVRTVEVRAVVRVFLIVLGTRPHPEWDNHFFYFSLILIPNLPFLDKINAFY